MDGSERLSDLTGVFEVRYQKAESCCRVIKVESQGGQVEQIYVLPKMAIMDTSEYHGSYQNTMDPWSYVQGIMEKNL